MSRQKGQSPVDIQKVRRTLHLFLEANLGNLQKWIQQVADGDPEHEVKPDPAEAFKLVTSLIEYSIPKLARTELAGDPDQPVTTSLTIKFERPADQPAE